MNHDTTKTTAATATATTTTPGPTDACTGGPPACRPPETTRWAQPRSDLWSGEDGGHVLIDLPGVAPDGLDVHVDGDELVVEARSSVTPLAGRALHVEWAPVSYRRRFRLHAQADPDAIEARLENGVLELTVPLRESAKPRRIEVRHAD